MDPRTDLMWVEIWKRMKVTEISGVNTIEIGIGKCQIDYSCENTLILD